MSENKPLISGYCKALDQCSLLTEENKKLIGQLVAYQEENEKLKKRIPILEKAMRSLNQHIDDLETDNKRLKGFGPHFDFEKFYKEDEKK